MRQDEVSGGKRKREHFQVPGLHEGRNTLGEWEIVREIIGLSPEREIHDSPSSYSIPQRRDPAPLFISKGMSLQLPSSAGRQVTTLLRGLYENPSMRIRAGEDSVPVNYE